MFCSRVSLFEKESRPGFGSVPSKASALAFLAPLLFIAATGRSIQPGALDVRIPAYDGNGRLLWELSASEVDLLEKQTYDARNPQVRVLQGNQPTLSARSSSGTFDLESSYAKGSDALWVEGSGFQAVGRPWQFESGVSDGSTKLSFSDRSEVGFDFELGPVLTGETSGQVEGSSRKELGEGMPHEKIDDNEFPTLARSRHSVVLDLGGGNHKFLLENEVLIEMKIQDENASGFQVATISCSRLVVDLKKDSNTSDQGAFGQIVRIHAEGNVVMNDPARKCSAEQLLWLAEEGGSVLLEGDALVLDRQWGEARGEKIILRKEDGRAEVIGGKDGWSRIALPAIPAFSFPKLPNRKNKKTP